MKRTEDNLRDLWDNIKHTNSRIIGVPEEEKKKGYEKIFKEIIVENFPSMEKEIVNQVQGGLPFPSPGDLSDPGIKPGSPALQADSLPTEL